MYKVVMQERGMQWVLFYDSDRNSLTLIERKLTLYVVGDTGLAHGTAMGFV